jgi:hypothetical protein
MRRNLCVTQALLGEFMGHVMWVSVCLSIGYYGLSDIYGNIAGDRTATLYS